MRIVISIFIIQQLLYFTSTVESLQGQNIRQVKNGDLPFIAALQYFPHEGNFCTGVLITKRHVITIASCLEGERPAKTRVAFQVVSSLEDVGIEVLYEVISWQSYYNWAVGQGLHDHELDYDGIAVVRLKGEVAHLNPARLSHLTKRQNYGKKNIITGWKNSVISNGVLMMSVVRVITDAHCNLKQREITHRRMKFGPRLLCNYATTPALLEKGDAGAPMMDIHQNIVGLALGLAPDVPKNYSDTSKQHQVNVHFSIDYYRHFIMNITGYN